MTATFRTALSATLLGLSLLGSVQAAPAEREVVQVQLREAAAPAPARAEPDRELAADMSEHLDPRLIAGIAGAIGLYSVVSAIRRRRTEDGFPKAV